MKKYLTLEVLIDEEMEDAKEYAREVISFANRTEYCCDGTVEIKVKREDRKETLLRACLELLQKQEEASYVLDLLYETVYYDDADCDGFCLIDDIKNELNIKD